MQQVDVMAVVGVCAPERMRFAKRLATRTGRELIPATRLAMSPDPVDEAATIGPWIETPAGAVIELPQNASITEFISALIDRDAWMTLTGIVCVADAAHLLDDLQRDTYAVLPALPWQHPSFSRHVADATLTVTQLEYASTIVLVNWSALSTAELSTVMALVNHLSPQARLRLWQGTVGTWMPGDPYTASQERPGWVGLLNGEYATYMTDPHVGAFRYENVRPLHPTRLSRLLEEQLEPGAFGRVIRSAGFCRLASRSQIVAQWDHVGRVISFEPLGRDDDLDDDDLLALGQDLAIIGLDLDSDGLITALDAVALTDEELAAGPALWADFTDPFPAWPSVEQRFD